MAPRASGRGTPVRGASAARAVVPRGGIRGGPARGRGGPAAGLPSGDHVTTVGVKRPGFGTAGRRIPVLSNFFETSIPEGLIHHYDVISPAEKVLPLRVTVQIIDRLQKVVAPQVFNPPAAYDGRKNMFSSIALPLGPNHSQRFEFTLEDTDATPGGRPPRLYGVTITRVATINPENLERFIHGEQSLDSTVYTAIMALNVAIRMEPTLRYPFNIRSFFTEKGSQPIGGGLELWVGYFQSMRPGIGRMFVNVDTTTGVMYRGGSLIDLCLDFFGRNDPNILAPTRGLPDRERLRLARFISGLRVNTKRAGKPNDRPRGKTIRKLSTAGADQLTFSLASGENLTVAQYFERQNQRLRFPSLLCVEVGAGALIPLELCQVPRGQIIRKQVPPEKTDAMVKFSTKKPAERLQSIVAGLTTMQYGQSDYVRQFGIRVETAKGPTQIEARVLRPPTLRYGGTVQPTIEPKNGAWNMVDKQLYRPTTQLGAWVLAIFDPGFRPQTVNGFVTQFVKILATTGINVPNDPFVKHVNAQRNVVEQLQNIGRELFNTRKVPPTLFVVILPEGGNEIYTAVKHFGDVVMGVPTQCLKGKNCFQPKPQYLANVALKINVKMGGVNVIADPSSVAALVDPRNPTIVMGADVAHPAPGSGDKPSFAALVSSVDSNSSKYVATMNPQTSRVEMIEDLEAMCKRAIQMYMDYQKHVEKKATQGPKRIIFYRDGVSEGQFGQVKELELRAIKNACAELNISPKITFVIVGKRHHARFFPKSPNDADRSGNCPAGTVIDTDIVHPLEFDFYLQSHGGLLGTSRSAHYSVLHDENEFSADAMQSLSFALCHVYARATRSVSIPAPIYYADIVCARAKNHYDPTNALRLDDTTNTSDTSMLGQYRANFKPLHPKQSKLMYFS
ncbi:argonaute-like protein [Mycena floridula]|nr:argonaute-like protein [Mycena floridula]